MTGRTKLQREANELDLDMFNLARRLDAFRPMIPKGPWSAGHAMSVIDAAIKIRQSRAYVRHYMHPDDIKRTKEADEK